MERRKKYAREEKRKEKKSVDQLFLWIVLRLANDLYEQQPPIIGARTSWPTWQFLDGFLEVLLAFFAFSSFLLYFSPFCFFLFNFLFPKAGFNPKNRSMRKCYPNNYSGGLVSYYPHMWKGNKFSNRLDGNFRLKLAAWWIIV